MYNSLNLEQIYDALRISLDFMTQDRADNYYNPHESEIEYVRDALREVETHLNELDNCKTA